MATLDVHLEAPPKATRNLLGQPDAKFIFNKTIAGHYRTGREYEKVGVLLLTWESDDMDCKTLEVGFTNNYPGMSAKQCWVQGQTPPRDI